MDHAALLCLHVREPRAVLPVPGDPPGLPVPEVLRRLLALFYPGRHWALAVQPAQAALALLVSPGRHALPAGRFHPVPRERQSVPAGRLGPRVPADPEARPGSPALLVAPALLVIPVGLCLPCLPFRPGRPGLPVLPSAPPALRGRLLVPGLLQVPEVSGLPQVPGGLEIPDSPFLRYRPRKGASLLVKEQQENMFPYKKPNIQLRLWV